MMPCTRLEEMTRLQMATKENHNCAEDIKNDVYVASQLLIRATTKLAEHNGHYLAVPLFEALCRIGEFLHPDGSIDIHIAIQHDKMNEHIDGEQE